MTIAALPESVLTSRQVKTFTKFVGSDVVVAEVRYDDECHNGHNSFAITCSLYDRDRISGESSILNAKGKRRWLGSCGRQHDLVAEHFPELRDAIQWHLVGSDGPTHYIANTVYNAECGMLEYARSSAVWPDATLEQLRDAEALKARLPELMERFKAMIEGLGFAY